MMSPKIAGKSRTTTKRKPRQARCKSGTGDKLDPGTIEQSTASNAEKRSKQSVDTDEKRAVTPKAKAVLQSLSNELSSEQLARLKWYAMATKHAQ